ncbi:hypothetical protein [Fodinibius sp.]|uniref:hypothetical protein n=1 Tax=Fodinibius sp. TaxID=1872440 RepID=UPI002ACD2791|nr:hypothetical protein [Fodinibius sp.]MDZ7659449.1 hypothetical protein [Fodinibius sp.]
MKTISIRGLDEETAAKLKDEAKRKNLSVNALVLDLVRRGIGLKPASERRRVYHDLDHLAGSWSQEEAAQFLESIQCFEEVDKELWRETDTSRY